MKFKIHISKLIAKIFSNNEGQTKSDSLTGHKSDIIFLSKNINVF